MADALPVAIDSPRITQDTVRGNGARDSLILTFRLRPAGATPLRIEAAAWFGSDGAPSGARLDVAPVPPALRLARAGDGGHVAVAADAVAFVEATRIDLLGLLPHGSRLHATSPAIAGPKPDPHRAAALFLDAAAEACVARPPSAAAGLTFDDALAILADAKQLLDCHAPHAIGVQGAALVFHDTAIKGWDSIGKTLLRLARGIAVDAGTRASDHTRPIAVATPLEAMIEDRPAELSGHQRLAIARRFAEASDAVPAVKRTLDALLKRAAR